MDVRQQDVERIVVEVLKKMMSDQPTAAATTVVAASGCDCGSINAMITMAKMETIQTVNANTTAEAASIRSEILVAAQNIIGTIKSESATIRVGPSSA